MRGNKLRFAFAMLLLLNSCGNSSEQHLSDSQISPALQKQYSEEDSFSYPTAILSPSDKVLTLWATYYYLPQFREDTGDFALRDLSGRELGPRLSLSHWCNSALEGSVQILSANGVKTYNYAGVSDSYPVDCRSIFSFQVGKTKFREARGPFGDGVDNFILVPYRTIATDPNIIPVGSVLYIPEARGAIINLPDGKSIRHDGYFFAGDVGGAIKRDHIDVFIGFHSSAPFFPWIGSNSGKTFSAYYVTDPKIIDELTKMHLKQ